jgi:L-aminopeptidase/D-esterase-like protein
MSEALSVPGILFASSLDSSGETGATAFYFPNGASFVYDSRGGSVAACETSLLDPGSYSNVIDALVFAGGSTMGLEASDGLRKALFLDRTQGKKSVRFSDIPSVPGAVVYDFGPRLKAPLAYPDSSLGFTLLKEASTIFVSGRAGAGINTTANKLQQDGTFFSGQGISVQKTAWGSLVFAVVLNPLGNIVLEEQDFGALFGSKLLHEPPAPRSNTTLSMIYTDIPLSRNQLQRLASSAHAALASCIQPFHTPFDGDILFAGALQQDQAEKETVPDAVILQISTIAVSLAKNAVKKAVLISNGKTHLDE